MAETIRLKASDGAEIGGYLAVPSGTPKGHLVVVMEIFGVNHHIRNVTDRFTADGYLALAPALFDRVEPGYETGYAPEDVDQGRAVRQKLGWDVMVMDVRAAVAELRNTGLRVGVVGYCMGGTVAWLAATRIDGVAAAVGYYGGGIADTATERPRCPVMLHFGETDTGIPADHWERIRQAHPALPLHVYPAGHGFSCDERGSFHEPSHRLARERTIAFFRQHVG